MIAAAALAVAAAGCGAGPEAEVEQSFRDFRAALSARDFPAACAYNTPEATAKLLAAVKTQGITANSCETAFAAAFAEPGAAETADGVSRSLQIKEVAVTGDEATIAWTASLDGEPRPVTDRMRRIDGKWRFVPGA